MVTRYSGTFDELKAKLASLEAEGEWVEINANQLQFRHKVGGVLNWFPSTGSINFQGKPAGRDLLQARVSVLLHASAAVVPETQMAKAPDERKLPEPQPDVIEREAAPKPSTDTSEALRSFSDSEIIIGLVGAVGTDMGEVINVLADRLKIVGYTTHTIKVSEQVIPKLTRVDVAGVGEATRITRLMDAGDEVRKRSGDSGILASGIAAEIVALRSPAGTPLKRTAFIVNSLKHPDEVLRLRQIYPRGFYLIGVHPDESVRTAFLKRKGVNDDEIDALVQRDQDEHLRFGQRVNDTFHLSDFFVRLDNDRLKLEKSLLRIFDILLATPTKRQRLMSLRCSSRSQHRYALRTCLAKLEPWLPKGTRFLAQAQMIAQSLAAAFIGHS